MAFMKITSSFQNGELGQLQLLSSVQMPHNIQLQAHITTLMNSSHAYWSTFELLTLTFAWEKAISRN